MASQFIVGNIISIAHMLVCLAQTKNGWIWSFAIYIVYNTTAYGKKTYLLKTSNVFLFMLIFNTFYFYSGVARSKNK